MRENLSTRICHQRLGAPKFSCAKIYTFTVVFYLLPFKGLWLSGGCRDTEHPVCYTSECMGCPALGPYKAEWGRTQLSSPNRPVGPGALRPAFKDRHGRFEDDSWYLHVNVYP